MSQQSATCKERLDGADTEPPRSSLPSSRPVHKLLWGQQDVFQSVWEHASDAMALSDPEGTVLAANPAYFRLYGYPAEAVIGQCFSIIFPPEQRAWALAGYKETFADPTIPPSVEAVVRRPDGSERSVESRIEYLTADGKRVAMLSVVRDITERKHAEAERARLLEAEQRARVEAQEALRQRDMLLSIASHELKTPVTVLMGNVELLRRRAQPNYLVTERDQRALRVIADQVQRLNQLIVDLLDVSRLETGQLSIERAPVDIGALTRRVIEEMQPALGAHRVAFADADAPQMIIGDELRLEQVLYNLLENATKYSPAGSAIDVRVERCERWVCVAVSDSGIGIPQGDLLRLFDRFYRAGNVDAAGLRGIGLGLFVVKEIMTLHGGRVEVESTEGQGSTFTIFLPLSAMPGG